MTPWSRSESFSLRQLLCEKDSSASTQPCCSVATGQVMSPRPTVAEYDAIARQWLAEVVLPRQHRTAKRVIAEARNEEQRCSRRYRIT